MKYLDEVYGFTVVLPRSFILDRDVLLLNRSATADAPSESEKISVWLS